MDLSRLRLWQDAALRPGECDSSLWTARKRTTASPSPTEEDELRRIRERSREQARKKRAVVLHGLILCVLFGFPTGFVYGYNTVVDGLGIGGGQCIRVSGMLDAGLQRGLHEYRSAFGLSQSEEALLGAEVCDPLLKSVVPSIVARITSDVEVRSLGQAAGLSNRRAGGWSMLRAVVGAGAQ